MIRDDFLLLHFLPPVILIVVQIICCIVSKDLNSIFQNKLLVSRVEVFLQRSHELALRSGTSIKSVSKKVLKANDKMMQDKATAK